MGTPGDRWGGAGAHLPEAPVTPQLPPRHVWPILSKTLETEGAVQCGESSPGHPCWAPAPVGRPRVSLELRA